MANWYVHVAGSSPIRMLTFGMVPRGDYLSLTLVGFISDFYACQPL